MAWLKSRPAFAAGLSLLPIVLLLSIASSTTAQEPPDSTTLADSAETLSQQAEQAYQQGTREALERAGTLWIQVGEISRHLGDRRREAIALGSIGIIHSRLGRPDSALFAYRRALTVQREVGDRRAEGATLNNMGNVYSRLGQPDAALDHYRQALAIRRDIGDQPGEASTLNNIGSVHSRSGQPDSALLCYSQALAIHRAVGNRRGEAGTLGNVGIVHYERGHPDSALFYYGQSLAITRETGDRRREGNTLGNMGNVHYALGRPDSALVYLRQAVAIHREVGNRYAEGGMLTNIGETYRVIGRPDSALIHFRQAIVINRELGDRRGEGATLANVGLLHSDLGHPDSALSYYRQALAIHRQVGDKRTEGLTLSNIGNIHSHLGRLDSALLYYHHSLVVVQELGDRGGEGNALGNIGNIHYSLGRPDSALSYFYRTLNITREVGDRRGEGLTLGNISNAHAALGRSDSALSYLRQALHIHRGVGDRATEGGTLRNIGNIYGKVGHHDSALTYYRQALGIAREVRDRAGEGMSLNNIGTEHRDLGRADSALVHYQRALAIEREVGEKDAEGATLSNLARLHHRYLAAPSLTSAVAYYDSAAAVRASIASHAGSDPNRAVYTEQFVGLYRNWALAWLALADEVGPERAARSALAVIERGRAQALLELMQASAQEAEGVVSPVQALTTPGADLAAEGARLVESVTQSGAAGLSYLVTNDTLLVWLIEPSGEVTVARQAVPSDSVAALVGELRAGLGADDVAAGEQLAARGVVQLESTVRLEGATQEKQAPLDLETAAQALTRLLLPPEIAARLPESGELVIVPQGRLALVPFSVLPLGNTVERSAERLGNPYAIRYAPSLATLGHTQARTALGTQRERREAFSRALLVGNPKMPSVQMATGERSKLAPLPDAEVETGWLADRLGASVLTGAEATESAIRQRLAQSRLVHLATHGYAYSSDALARSSFVALASDEKHDGFLTVGEILDDSDITLSAELVVLSACQTGLGDLKEAEGTIGFQRSFLAKGARSVLVSLWNISDEATVRLMKAFYTHWLDDADSPTKAEALHRAQEDLRNTPGFEDPLYWAAFQLVGAN